MKIPVTKKYDEDILKSLKKASEVLKQNETSLIQLCLVEKLGRMGFYPLTDDCIEKFHSYLEKQEDFWESLNEKKLYKKQKGQ